MGEIWAFGSDIDSVVMPGQRMLSAISQSQQAVANNIANVNTPGYQAQRPNFQAMLESVDSPFETALSVKMGGGSEAMSLLNPPAGKVNLQQELMSMQDNVLKYNLVTTHLSKVLARLKEVAQVGR